MHTGSPTQSQPRLTPWMIAIIVVAFVLLTASGCRSGKTQEVAHPTPPLEETTGRVAATAASPAAPPQRPESSPDTQHVPPVEPRTTPASTQVLWTTGAVGEASTPAPTPAHAMQPVAHDPLDQALDLSRDGASAPAAASVKPTAPEPTAGESAGAAHAGADPAPLALFYVFGEVEHAGPYHHTGRNRVLDVVAQVKPTRRANPAKVTLVRPRGGGAGEADVYTINVDRMVRGGDLSDNHRLEAGDILYVPPTGGAKLVLGLGSILGLSGPNKPGDP